MSLQGTLETIPLPDVLTLLSATRKSGELKVAGAGVTGRVWVRDGAVVGADVPRAATPVDAVFELLRLAGGNFAFDSEAAVPEAGEPVAVDALVAEAQERLGEWRAIEAVVPSLACTLNLAAELADDSVTLYRPQWKDLVAVAAAGDVDGLMRHLGVGEYDACRTVKALADAGLVTVGPVPEPAPVPTAGPEPREEGPVLPHQWPIRPETAPSAAAERSAATRLPAPGERPAPGTRPPAGSSGARLAPAARPPAGSSGDRPAPAARPPAGSPGDRPAPAARPSAVSPGERPPASRDGARPAPGEWPSAVSPGERPPASRDGARPAPGEWPPAVSPGERPPASRDGARPAPGEWPPAVSLGDSPTSGQGRATTRSPEGSTDRPPAPERPAPARPAPVRPSAAPGPGGRRATPVPSAEEADELVQQLASLSRGDGAPAARPATTPEVRPAPSVAHPAPPAHGRTVTASAPIRSAAEEGTADAGSQTPAGAVADEPINRGMLLKFLSSVRP